MRVFLTDMSSTILIRGAEIWSPAPLGRRDVLCGGGSILAVAEGLGEGAPPGTLVIDGAGLKLVPGLIDGHVHIAGAGGEGPRDAHPRDDAVADDREGSPRSSGCWAPTE